MKTAIEVADYILNKAKSNNDTVTPMQLLKLVYLCHGWMLGLYGRQLVSDEVEAWQYGPVIRSLYEKVRQFKSNAVEGPLSQKTEVVFDAAERSIMDQIYTHYGQYSGPSLSRLTHKEGSPWHKTWTLEGKNSIISNDIIEDYYRNLSKAQTT
jgi:uncharacterized phage-associated protein